MSRSEVARIRQQIELECEALQRIMRHEYAMSASHAIVSHKFRYLDKCHDRLKPLVGEDEAMHIVIETYTRMVR